MRLRPLLFILGICLASACCAAPLVFCHEDKADFPWRTADGEGLDLFLVKQVSKAVHTPFVLQALPWQRCTQALQNGTVDGVIGVSFLPERLSWGQYPMFSEHEPDTSKRLHTASYSLYYLKDNPVAWDGKVLRIDQGPVGMQTGFSIGKLLQKQHVTVYDSSNNPLGILSMLSRHRLGAAALQTSRTDELLAEHQELARVIVRHPIPLEEKPYYMMLSNRLVTQQPDLARHIWDSIAQLRESHAYQVLHQQIQNQMPR